MNEERHSEKVKKAKIIYLDLIDLLSTDEKLTQLLANIPGKDLMMLLDDLEHMFVKEELYEKCKRIKRWKEKVALKISPDKIFHHLY